MDDGSSSLETNLFNELMQGKELANQLLLHLNSSSFSRREKGELLVKDIVMSYENALSILLRRTTGPSQDPPGELALGSPRRSGESDSKKRKNVIRWTKKVRIGMGDDLEDGYNWRKYGQKDIHGTNFPRNYFKCTQRNTQGCLATKQVQRSDDDPTIFNVSYRGSHTCNNNSITSTVTPLSQPPAINVDNSLLADPKFFSPNTLFESQTGLLDVCSKPVDQNDNAPSSSNAAGFDYFSSGFMDEAELTFTFDNSKFFE